MPRSSALARLLGVVSLAASLAGAPAAHAHGGSHGPGKVHVGNGWDFTLPTLDGSSFVTASSPAGPVLVNFWGVDCAPCIAELPRLQAFAEANPQWTVLLVSTDAPARAQTFVQRHGVTLTVLRPGANVLALMRSAGNPQGALPFSVGLREGRICRTQLGELHGADLARWSAACTTP